MSLFKAFRERITAFRDDTEGSMAVMFGLTIAVMVSFAGAALDLTRVVQAQALLQQATDSAAISAVGLARAEGADLSSISSFDETVGNFMEANLKIALANDAPVGLSADYQVNVSAGTLTVTSQALLPAGLTRIFGVVNLDIEVRSVVHIPPVSAPATALPYLAG